MNIRQTSYKTDHRYNNKIPDIVSIHSQNRLQPTAAAMVTLCSQATGGAVAALDIDNCGQRLQCQPVQSSYLDQINNILRQWRDLRQEKQQVQLLSEKKNQEYDEFDRIMDEDLENQLKELEIQEEQEEERQYKKLEQMTEKEEQQQPNKQLFDIKELFHRIQQESIHRDDTWEQNLNSRNYHKLQELQTRLSRKECNMKLSNSNYSNQTLITIEKQRMKQMNTIKEIDRQCKQKMTKILGKSFYKMLTNQSFLNKQEQSSRIKSNYLNMTNSVFKQLLFTTLGSNNDFIVQSLDTTEKLNYVRQYAQLICNLYCLKYEQDLWQTYYKISVKANIWSTTAMTKETAYENSLHRYLFTTRVNIEKRQKKLNEQLMKIEHDLNKFLQYQQLNNLFIDLKVLLRLVTSLVGNNLSQLRTVYVRKTVLFQYDANDYRLVKLFYDLQPTKDQIHSAKFIWQVTAYQLKIEEQLFVFKKTLFLSHGFIDNKKMNEIIENYKNLICHQKKKLLQEPTLLSSSIFARLMDIVELRQNNMHERTQLLLRH